MLPFAKREGERLFGTNKWVFQQDGASCHNSKTSQEWCENHLFKFLDRDHWPANSPDLNPLDFYFWNAVVTKMKVSSDFNLERLQLEIKKAFDLIDKEEIKKAVLSFTKRVRAVERANGNYCHI